MRSSSLGLLARDADTRAEVASYLTRAGYLVRVVDRPASRIAYLVWLADADEDHDHEAIATAIDAWLAPSDIRRAVLVTRRPAAFVELLRAHAARLIVLPAPVFGWELVDALRARTVSW